MAGEQMPTPLELIPADGFVIEFPDISPSQAGFYAEKLENDLRNAREDEGMMCEIQRIRVSPETQDLGTVIAIVLGAEATVAIAKGIAKWLYRNNQAALRIKKHDGSEVMITNLESENVEGIVRALAPTG